MIQASNKNEITLPPSEICVLEILVRKLCSLDFSLSVGFSPKLVAFESDDLLPKLVAFESDDLLPKLVAFENDDLLPKLLAFENDEDHEQVLNIMECFFSNNNKVIVTIKDAIETRIKATSVTRKNVEITSKEDLIAIPKRVVPQTADTTWRIPALATQLLARCSSDSTFFCRFHSPRIKTTSEVAFPNSRKGTNNAVGEREMFAIEIRPAALVKGNRMDKRIGETVLRQLRLKKER